MQSSAMPRPQTAARRTHASAPGLQTADPLPDTTTAEPQRTGAPEPRSAESGTAAKPEAMTAESGLQDAAQRPGTNAPGLRQRKKLRQRQAIAEVAMRLFVERGFDAVSVAEVARAADVAENTVFNYFPTKEDLFFDREAEVEDAFSRAIRTRPPGESIVAALRRTFREALDREDPRIGLSAGMPLFWRLIDASPRLQARQATIGQRSLLKLAEQFVAEGIGGPDAAVSRALASLAASVPWALQLEIRRRLSAGESVASVKASMRPLAERGFDLLASGIGETGASA
jgi:AcrR family transcriptional regulator